MQPLERAAMFAIGELNGRTKVAAVTGRFGLQLYDVSNPAVPVRTSQYKQVGPGRRIKFGGAVVSVADGAEGVQLIDVSNPEKPVSAGSYKTPLPAVDVATEGQIVLVAMGPAGQAGAAVMSGLQPKRSVLILHVSQAAK
jgi:hypothetical protein